MLDRILEPEIQTPEEDIFFCKYKELVGIENDLNICLQLIPEHIIALKGEGLQIIDLGGGDGLFSIGCKKALPNATIINIDKSEIMIRNAVSQEIQTIHDDLLHFGNYIDGDKQILIVCRGTIHHLPYPEKLFSLISKLPNTVGLFLKDLVRPISEELIEQTTKEVMSLAMGLNNSESKFYNCIYKLTVQSLRAALSDTEIEQFASIISGSAMQKNSNKTYFELSRTL